MAITQHSSTYLRTAIGNATAANEIETLLESGEATTFTFSPAAGGANVCEVTVTVKDANGSTVAGVFNFDIWLSDDSSGAGLTATTASGTVTVKTSSGAVIGTHTSKKALRAQTLATGVFILEITDSAKTAFYVCAQAPGSGKTAVSTVLATANYG